MRLVICPQDVLVQKDGRQFVDFTKFHDTVPIKEQQASGAHCTNATSDFLLLSTLFAPLWPAHLDVSPSKSTM